MASFSKHADKHLKSICVASILLSKFTHMHHHYTFERFQILDVFWLPSLIFYDVMTYLFIYTCLSGRFPRILLSQCTSKVDVGIYSDESSHARSSDRANPAAYGKAIHLAGCLIILAIAYFAAADFYVYMDFGSPCSWPTVLEVTTSPKSIHAFVTQWMSLNELYFIFAIPFGMTIMILCSYWGALYTRKTRIRWVQTRTKAQCYAGVGAAFVVLGLLPRPWNGISLVCASAAGWLLMIIHLLDYVDLYHTPAALPSPSSSSIVSQNLRPTGGAVRKCCYFAIIAVLSFFVLGLRRPALDDIAITVPASVIFSFLGLTPKRCPVGKEWPRISKTIRPDLLDYVRSMDTGNRQNLRDIPSLSAFWDLKGPPAGFDMHSSEKAEKWARWARLGNKHFSSQPSGYNFLFDDDKVWNLQNQLLPELQTSTHSMVRLSDSNFRNILFFTMESTPDHFFPVSAGSNHYNRTTKSRKRDTLYEEIEGLMPTAERIFGKNKSPNANSASGIVVHGAETASSYTMKSLLASHCGLSPLPMDFMREAEADSHLYQPCLPHILKAMDQVRYKDADLKGSKELGWKILYTQSVQTQFDRQWGVMEKMGFDIQNEMLVKENMERPEMPYPLPESVKKGKNANSFYPEKYLHPYLRDFFRESKMNDQRFFLSHLTTTPHSPWDLPPDWDFKKFGEDVNMNKILNAMAYQDEWLTDIFDMMEREGVLNDTLVVISSDHGTALSDGDLKLSLPFHNPHIHNFAIPLAILNPNLPRIALQANVSNVSILPTILDLLASSDSLTTERERNFVKTLLPHYEGQSLIRHLNFETKPNKPPDSRAAMSFGLLNPGRGHVTAFSPDPKIPWRLSVPLCQPGTLTAANLHQDPLEMNPIRTLDIKRLISEAEARWGQEAGEWFAEAERRGTVWIREISRRWGVDQRSPPGDMVRRWT